MKPLPKTNAQTLPFWEGCLAGEVRFQVCDNCAHLQFPPGSICTKCHETQLRWQASAGQGVVYSYTMVNRAPRPEFREDAPYIIALVDLDEGLRLMMNVRGDDALDTAIGDRVEVIFETTEREDIKLPQAKRLAS